MNLVFIKFLKGFTLYTLVIVLISVAINYALPEIQITPVYLYLIAFMYAINFLMQLGLGNLCSVNARCQLHGFTNLGQGLFGVHK